MSEDALVEREKVRYAVLKAMYDLTEGKGLNHKTQLLSSGEIARHVSADRQQVENALIYLHEEGLTGDGTFGGDDGALHELSHKGVKEIEASLRSPKQDTEHFSSVTIKRLIVQGNVGALGSQNTVSFTQNVNSDSAAIANLITQLKSDVTALPASEQQEALEYVEDMEAGAAPLQPRLSKLRAAGMAMGNLLKTANQTTGNLAEFLGRFGIDLPQL